MFKQWRRTKLSDHVEIAIGGTPSRVVPTFWAEKPAGQPWLAISDLRSKYLFDTREHISDLGVRSSNVKLIPTGSAVMSFKLSVGRTGITTRPMYSNEAIAAFLPLTDVINSAWLYHALPQAAATIVTDSAVKGVTLNKKKMAQMTILLPTPSEQRVTALILDTLDTTISQTEAIIEKLKQVRQGLLHDLLTRGIAANGKLRPPQSEAPDLYKESPLGWIPKEWSAGSLSDWLDGKPKNGYSPQEAGRWTGSQMLGLGCLTSTGFTARQLKNAPAGDPLLRPALLADGTLLMSRANTRNLVGLAGIYRDVGTPCYYPDLMMCLKPSVRTTAAFLEVVLGSAGVRRQIQSYASGTSGSMVKISSVTVMALRVAILDVREQTQILNTLMALNNQFEREAQFIEAQRSVKSGLMDDLLTGRVRVTPLLVAAGVAA